MLETQTRFAFHLHACQHAVIGAAITGQKLDRHVPLRSSLTRTVHPAHTTCPQNVLDSVVVDDQVLPLAK